MPKHFDSHEDAAITTILGIITNDFTTTSETMQNAEQLRALRTCKLPRSMHPSKDVFENIGFSFEEIDDELLYQGTLPEGWKLEKSDFYYANIIDEKGRKRGTIFYKSSFYDREAEMKLYRKYNVAWKYIEYARDGMLMEIFVEDFEHNVLTVIGTCTDIDWREQDKLFKKGEKFLDKNYPNWKDCCKYWD